jgi:hypothetical protein
LYRPPEYITSDSWFLIIQPAALFTTNFCPPKVLYRVFLRFPVGALVSVDEPLPVLEDEEPLKGLLAYISVFFRSSLCEMLPWNKYTIYSV